MNVRARAMAWADRAWRAVATAPIDKALARGRLACARHPKLAELDAGELAHLVESADVPWERRLAAGTLLGWRGDPRLDPLQPALVAYPGVTVTLGLPFEAVDAALATWGRIGVKREWIEKECPAYEVTLAPFALARLPVTNLEYRAFLDASGAAWRPSAWPSSGWPAALANHPVWSVPAEAADAYAAWLAQRTGRPFRLPTEAEWEYAAGGAPRREYPWGDDFDAQRANTAELGIGSTTPVGMHPAGNTPEGVADLGGNVEEITADTMHPYPGGHVVDDAHRRALGAHRVTRGGSFLGHGDLARCRRRHGGLPGAAVGFRVALSLPATE